MEGLLDCHTHLAALPDGRNGAFVSARMRKGAVFRFVSRAMGLRLDDPERSNRAFLERLVSRLKESRCVTRAVALALDGVYDASGRFDPERTGLLVPNDLVFQACAEFQELLPGASVNPARRDALDELARVAERGAVLLKCLPNAMGFDPADPKYRPFWKKAARLGLPVLTHVGHEFAVTGPWQEMGDPARLRPLLTEGVTVIAAHAGSSGRFFRQPYAATVVALAREFPRFFLDSSALTLPNRMGMLWRIARKGSEESSLAPRLLFGTDFPLPVSPVPLYAALRPAAGVRARRIANSFDRQAFVLTAFGLPPDPGLAGRVLRLPVRQAKTRARGAPEKEGRASRAKA